jgi:hypothetical protein
MKNSNIQYYKIAKNVECDSNKFKYKLVDIQIENFTNQIKDEEIRDRLLNKNVEKYDEEKEKLLYDLSLLENVSEIKQ